MKSPTAPTPVSTGAATSRQRRKEARPQELLDAALELFVERGFAATRSEDVAARAGVSKGTLYLYYPSKEELLKAVVRAHLGGLIAEAADIAVGFEGDTRQLLSLLMHTWWTRIGDTPASGIFKIILTEMGNFPDFARFYAEEVIEPGVSLFSRVLQRGIDAGELASIDVFETVHVLIFPMLMLCLHRHSAMPCEYKLVELDPHSFIDTHVDVVVNGIRRRDPVKAAPARARVTAAK
jgi:TetR/AcrR family transcriptional regulator